MSRLNVIKYKCKLYGLTIGNIMENNVCIKNIIKVILTIQTLLKNNIRIKITFNAKNRLITR